MNLTYKGILDYFNYLATNHKQIKSFVGFSYNELMDKISAYDSPDYPMLVLFAYEGGLNANKQRTIAKREVGFSILMQPNDPRDNAERYNLIGQAEEIGFQVLSRINHDSLVENPNFSWLYRNFIKDNVSFNELFLETNQSLCGMEFKITLETPEPIPLKQEDWLDTIVACQ
jgi:hypothetical protein